MKTIFLFLILTLAYAFVMSAWEFDYVAGFKIERTIK